MKLYCPHCSQTFSNRFYKNAHILDEHRGRRFRCDRCSIILTTYSEAMKHRNKDHEGDATMIGFWTKIEVSSKNVKKKKDEKENILETRTKQVDTVTPDEPKKTPLKEANADIERCPEDTTPSLPAPPSNPNAESLSLPLLKTTNSKKCPVCSKTFHHPSFLKRHWTDMHQGRRFRCNACQVVVKSYVSKNQHSRKHGRPVQFTEFYENTTVNILKSRKGSSNKKSAINDFNNRFVCGTCGTSFKEAKHLSKHELHIHRGRVYDCQLCRKTCKSRYGIDYHLRVAHGEKGKFTTRDEKRKNGTQITKTDQNRAPVVKMERQSIDNTGVESDIQNDVELKYKCLLCGKGFVSRGGMYKHKSKVHNTKSQFKIFKHKKRSAWSNEKSEVTACKSICDLENKRKRYTPLEKEDKHLVKYHQVGKHFICATCGLRLKYKSVMLRHVAVHDKRNKFRHLEKPQNKIDDSATKYIGSDETRNYDCLLCESKCKNKLERDAHVKKRHDENVSVVVEPLIFYDTKTPINKRSRFDIRKESVRSASTSDNVSPNNKRRRFESPRLDNKIPPGDSEICVVNSSTATTTKAKTPKDGVSVSATKFSETRSGDEDYLDSGTYDVHDEDAGLKNASSRLANGGGMNEKTKSICINDVRGSATESARGSVGGISSVGTDDATSSIPFDNVMQDPGFEKFGTISTANDAMNFSRSPATLMPAFSQTHVVSGTFSRLSFYHSTGMRSASYDDPLYPNLPPLPWANSASGCDFNGASLVKLEPGLALRYCCLCSTDMTVDEEDDDDFRFHLLQHLEPYSKKSRCPFCESDCVTNKRMTDHFMTTHGGLQKRVCAIGNCVRSFWTSRAVMRHEETHGHDG